MKTTFHHEVTLADGTIAKRDSISRQYSHAVIVTIDRPDGTRHEHVEGWSSRKALADSLASTTWNRLSAYYRSGNTWTQDIGKKLVGVRVVDARMTEHVTAGKKMAPATLAKRRLTKGAAYLVTNLAAWANPESADWTIDWAADQAKRVAHDARIVLGVDADR